MLIAWPTNRISNMHTARSTMFMPSVISTANWLNTPPKSHLSNRLQNNRIYDKVSPSNPGSHVVGIPKPCTEIQEDILSRRIIQVSYNQADNRNTDKDRLDGFGQLQIQHRQPECQCQCRNNKNPGKGAILYLTPFLRFHLKSGNRLSKII